MQKLPKGTQEFSFIREEDCAYVDKTGLLYGLISKEKFCFLSRPRRFGKSLIVSTLAELFRGKRDFFDGLAIASSSCDWTPHPVLALNFAGLVCDSPKVLKAGLNVRCVSQAKRMGVDLEPEAQPGETLDKLVRKLRQLGKVVLLIDEYDSPLLQNLDDPELTHANRQVLHDVFATVKNLESDLRFVFITGVSRFSKVSLFSGLNNLTDISFSPEYATLTGFTEDEIRSVFAEHLQAIAHDKQRPLEQILDQLRYWYNGYRFAYEEEAPSVYNPWSVIQFLASQKISNYWFSSATPTFAVQLIKQRGWTIADLEHDVIAGSELVETAAVDQIELVPLLYQTGYLTIESYDPDTDIWRLQTPNEEVLRSLVDHLLRSYVATPALRTIQVQLRQALLDCDLDCFFELLNTLFASVPYLHHVKQERFYHALVQMALKTVGMAVSSEVLTSKGKVDMLIETDQRLFLLEFKLDRPAHEALEQIHNTGYAEICGDRSKALTLVGVEISSTSRSVVAWEAA